MEATSNKVIEVLQYLSEKFGIMADWTSENIAPYIKDLIQRIAIYDFYSSLFATIVVVILFIICLMGLRNFYAYLQSDTADEFEELRIFFGILGGISIVILFIIGFCEVNEMIKAKTLPEVVAIEYLQSKAK